VRAQIDWLTLAPTAPPSPLLQRYRQLEHSPLGQWRFARDTAARSPLLRALQIRFEELRVGLCRAALEPHRRARGRDGAVDPTAIGALVQLSATMLVEISVPAGVSWGIRGVTLEHLRAAESAVTALARLDKSDWGQRARIGVPVTASDAAGAEVARAVVSFDVATRSG
jgi:acyl-coenzyme A thioesterase PaaI-like protein